MPEEADNTREGEGTVGEGETVRDESSLAVCKEHFTNATCVLCPEGSYSRRSVETKRTCQHYSRTDTCKPVRKASAQGKGKTLCNIVAPLCPTKPPNPMPTPMLC